MRWPLPAVAFGSVIALAASYARADTTYHVTANGSVATTDNALAAPADGDREADVFFDVRPGLLLAHEGPTLIDELTAEAEVLEYVVHNDQPSLQFRAAWRAFWTPGPRSQVTTLVDASTGKLSALAARTSPDQTGVMVQPAGQETVRQADVSESASYEVTEKSRLTETAYGHVVDTTDAMNDTIDSAEAGALGSIERTFDHDSLALELGGAYLRLDQQTLAMGVVGPVQLAEQIDPRARVIWRRDFGRRWSMNVDAGGVAIVPLHTIDTTVAQHATVLPAGGALVAYADTWGRATLQVRQTVAPNLLIAQNTRDDLALLQLALPLSWLGTTHTGAPKVNLLGSIGFDLTELLDANTSANDGTFYVTHFDLGVTYSPAPNQTYGLRYELLAQNGDSRAALLIPSYLRNTVYFTFALTFPPRRADALPRSTDSLRVDRSDLAPAGGGAEPVVPDAPVEEAPPADQ